MNEPAIEVTGDAEVITVNVSQAIYRLTRRGSLSFSMNDCFGNVTATLTMKDAVLKAEHRPLVTDRTDIISPVALCLLDLSEQVKALKA